MRRCQRDDSVAREPQSVHPRGHPISHSVNRGESRSKLRLSGEGVDPSGDVARERRKESTSFACMPSGMLSGRLPFAKSARDRAAHFSGGSFSFGFAALGVAHSSFRSSGSHIFSARRFRFTPRVGEVFVIVRVVVAGLASRTVAVGQDKEPRAKMRRPDALRAENVPLRIEPASGKVVDDDAQPFFAKAPDVLEEDPLDAVAKLVDDSENVSPKPASVPDAEELAALREGLAGEAGSDEMNAATPSSTVEGGDVVPDRSRIQGRVFHPGHESGRSVGFPLDVTHNAMPGLGELDPKLEAASPGT